MNANRGRGRRGANAVLMSWGAHFIIIARTFSIVNVETAKSAMLTNIKIDTITYLFSWSILSEPQSLPGLHQVCIGSSKGSSTFLTDQDKC